jgi:hypothetical protein
MMILNVNEENVTQNIKCPKMKQILNKDAMTSWKLRNIFVHIISLPLKCDAIKMYENITM